VLAVLFFAEVLFYDRLVVVASCLGTLGSLLAVVSFLLTLGTCSFFAAGSYLKVSFTGMLKHGL
jgi:hypothetical protein